MELAAAGGDAALYPLDMEGAGPDDYAELASRVADAWGRLDGVLHCAAEFRGLTPLDHADPAAFARAVHVNLTARWWLTQACVPLLRQAEDSAVVLVMDDVESSSQAFWGGYGIAQRGQEAMVEMLHRELANGPVRVSGLRPGPMFADMELIGIPHRVVVSERGLAAGTFEYRARRGGDTEHLDRGNLRARLGLGE